MSGTDDSLLSDDDFNELQAIADRFAEARKNGPIADWQPYLPPAGGKLRRPAIIECIKIDLEIAWQKEGGIRSESYVDRFPELNGLPVEVIVEEYRVRHLFGDKPSPDDFAFRFPDQYPEFQKRIEKIVIQRSAPKFAKGGSGPAPKLESLFPPGYKPGEFIGRGNFAEVWRAEAPGGIDIAIKIVTQPLDNDAAQREQQSLELIKKLQHPALLATSAFWIIENRLVIAMELADSSLLDRLKECQSQGLKGIPPDELLSYFRDAAEGLDWLHWQGVLHRDIKPENILLKKGYAKVADFGLARESRTSAMISVSFAGTPAFMAPEMWSGKASKHSDQYSLGFAYAQLRMGRRPLEGDDFVQVMTSAIEGEPDLAGLPEAEQTVLRRALAKRPEERFESCVDFVEALERALHPGSTVSRRRRPRHQTSGRLATSDDISSTERTERKLEKPKPFIDSNDKTIQQASIPANKQSKWPKTVAPPPGKINGAKLVLVALLVVALAAGGGGLAYLVVSGGGSTATSSKNEATFEQTTRKQPETSKREVVEPVKVWLPAPDKFAAHSEAQDVDVGGKKYHDRIVFRAGNAEVVFRLLKPESSNLAPFYQMETKISNALFEAFHAEMPGGNTKWKNEGATLPAVNITWDEADQCARWMKGHLPTPEQLDFAAGFAKPGGMNRDAGAPGVKLAQPRPVSDPSDRSPLGIFDLTGNGREWTSKTFNHGGEQFAILRGQNYRSSTPLTQKDLQAQQDLHNAQVQRTKVASPYTTFRVAIELPK